jgi:hypothetical protein
MTGLSVALLAVCTSVPDSNERARVKLAVTCELCHHEAVLPVGRWDDAGRGPRHTPGSSVLMHGRTGESSRRPGSIGGGADPLLLAGNERGNKWHWNG